MIATLTPHRVYRSGSKTFERIEDYFDYMAERFEYTPYHKFFENASVECDGNQLHLDVFEFHKNAPTIVMFPGTSLYSLCYVEAMYKIGKHGFNMVGLDPRGHGRSQGTRGDYTIDELIRDARAAVGYAIDRFNNQVSIMGSSQGGIVSFYLAAHDNRIQSAICQNFADLSSNETLDLARHPNLTKGIKPLLVNFGELLGETQLPIGLYLDLEAIKIKHFGTAKNFVEQDPLALETVSVRALRSLTATALPVPAEEISTPIMVFQGTEDSIFPVKFTQALYDKLSCKKKIEIFEGMNHALLTDNVEEVIPSVIDWLNEIYPKRVKSEE